jgi:hypothetical protein
MSRRRELQPSPGGPTDFSATDALVAIAARCGLRVLPVWQSPPAWAAVQPGVFGSPPADCAAVQRIFAGLARRYGAHGSFWRRRPRLARLPIRAWQVFNEPQLS